MTAPTATQDNIEQRRARVAQLRLRGLSSREICNALAKGTDDKGTGRIISPRTGLPYDHKVILSDLEALKLEWQASRGEATDKHIDRQFMEMQEIKRAGWAAKDPELARKVLRDEMDLLGTKKPQEINININIIYQIIELAEAQGMDASALFEGMLRRLQSANR